MQFSKMAVALLVGDIERTRRFYVDLLGFHPVFDMGWFATLEHGSGTSLDLWQREHASVPESLRLPSGGVVLAFVVTSAAAEAERLAAKGVRLVQPLTDNPWGQRNFLIQDPDGTVVDILERIPPDPDFLKQHGLA